MVSSNTDRRNRSRIEPASSAAPTLTASGSQMRDPRDRFESSGPTTEQLENEEDQEEEEEEEEEDEANPEQALTHNHVPDERSGSRHASGAAPPIDGTPAYDSDSSASGTDSLTWISWFCTLPGHEYFAEVAEDFIEDDFNLTGLMALVPFYKEALEMILDVEAEDDMVKIPDVSIVETSAELLYGLIHQRYIITRQGLAQMNAKYENAHFGYCPRVFCQTSKVVPCGRSDSPGYDTVALYCPNCMDTYIPPSSRFVQIDGAFFGTTFPHLLFQTYRDIPPMIIAHDPSPQSPPIPQSDLQSKSKILGEEPASGTSSACKIYGPRIYGFRVSERARSGSRMQWLRLRPRNEDELLRGLQHVDHEKDQELN